MERVLMTELKTHLSAYLKRVQAGGSVLVTEGGQPVATIAPVTPADEAWMELLAHFGLVSTPKAELTEDFFRNPPTVKDPRGHMRKRS